MKQFKRITAMVLVVLMLVPMLTAGVISASSTMAAALSGETSRSSKVLYPGVISTSIKTSSSSKYDLQSFNIVEFDLSQSDLYIDVTNERDYVNQTKSTLNTVTSFNSNNGNGKTAIAAINGDLWTMTSAHARVEGKGTSYNGYSDAVVTKSMTLPRGFSIYNGEIVCSSQIEEETPYEGDFWSFGVSDGYVPMIGCPELEISVNNTTQNVTVAADGLNRLPANNALVLYSDKGCASTNSLSDAYEVVIDVDYDYTVKHGASITGTVTGIYTSLTPASNPTMKANRFILTGRGSALERLKDFAVGDTVKLDFSVYERYGRNTEGWQNATCAVGGHMPFVVDGVKWETGTTTNYPTTIVGIKNDGNVVFIVNDGRQSSFSTGLDFNDYWDFADDMDLNTAFILDGGGSANLIETTGNGYSVVNSPSDGSTRSVVNSVILSAGPRRGAQDSFNVKVPSDNIDLTNINFADDDAYMLLTNFSETELEKTADGIKMKAKDVLNGPGLSISYGLPNTTSANSNSVLKGRNYDYVSATEYPYLVLDMSLVTADQSIVQFQSLYHTAGSRKGISQTTFIGFNNAYNNAGFNKYVIHTGSNSAFSGRLNTLHLTYLYPANGVTVRDGDYVILRSARLARTAQEAEQYKNDTAVRTTQTVNFDANGGKCGQSIKYAVHGQTYGVMPIPVRTGYDFTGWYTITDGGEKVTEDTSVTASSERTLYAHWQEKTVEEQEFYISFDPCGGTTSMFNYKILSGQKYSDVITDYAVPNRAGYTFDGWYCEDLDYTLDLNDVYADNRDYVFKAQWIKNLGRYMVIGVTETTLRSGPGSSYSSLGKLAFGGGPFEVTDISGNWAKTTYNGKEAWVSLDHIEIADELPSMKDSGYYWARVAELKLDLKGGGYNPHNPVSCGNVSAGKIGIADGTEQFDIYVYQGANTVTDSSFNNYFGVIYDVEGNVLSDSFYKLGDLLYVITGVMKKSGYKVSYLNTVFGEIEQAKFISDEALVKGSYFNGSAYIITPEWEKVDYTLTFDTDGGIMPEEFETEYVFTGDYKFNEVIGGYPVPKKEGYRFIGWQLEGASDLWQGGWGTQSYYFIDNITLIARWKDASLTDDGVIVEEDGNYYLEVEGERQEEGLYSVNGDYYYVKYDKTLARNEIRFMMYNRNLLPRGYRQFADDCKMVKDGWLTVTTEENGSRTFYLIDGYFAKGVTEIDGEYYFFNLNNGELRTDSKFYVGENDYNVVPGIYSFGSDGKASDIKLETARAVKSVSAVTDAPVAIGSGLDNYIRTSKTLAQNTASLTLSSETKGSDNDEE